jgi:hypothetical protein
MPLMVVPQTMGTISSDNVNLLHHNIILIGRSTRAKYVLAGDLDNSIINMIRLSDMYCFKKINKKDLNVELCEMNIDYEIYVTRKFNDDLVEFIMENY